MAKLLVIGGVSNDVLHLVDGSTHHVAGGAGLYVALAAARAGVDTTLLALRPDPMPAELEKLDQRLTWIGPSIAKAEMPSLEIRRFAGGHAELVRAYWGGDLKLSVAHLALLDTDFDAAYVAPLASDLEQKAFCDALRNRGIETLAGGTYARACQQSPAGVLSFINRCDVFFMNDNEATILYDSWQSQQLSSEQTIFVTRGATGATILTKTPPQHLLTTAVTEVDATGAGDTFAGTALATLLQGQPANAAAEAGMQAAGYVIQAIGAQWHWDIA